ncbi:MAG: DNA/RNA non-specific endonuclease [Lactobacillus sp.]|jgi:DNA-entry nuclease|nr:DNA/RNA non-specific endonuclease [Lactobacillus sp.]MCI2031909.1 DNA/RNA non-specific endonuclease [Lactobacillus sp.]
MKKLLTLLVTSAALLLAAGCGQQSDQATKTQQSRLTALTKANKATAKAVSSKESANRKTAAKISSLQAALNSQNQAAEDAKSDANELAGTKTTAKSTATDTSATLAAKDYSGQQEITVNGDKPGFSASELSTTAGAWERYSDLDGHNRATDANALLNQSLMPTSKREPLTWDPTGWHNRRTAHGWLYNRSHLIGFQLSGENNNPKNLITGTQSLNNPLMLAHEMDIATYLKGDAKRYVRYEVRPIFRGTELVARGVQMRAQSIGDNTISFNVYIFNIESGYTIDYATGTSTAS